MNFQTERQQHQILARLSLTALYIVLGIDLVVVVLGYFISMAEIGSHQGKPWARNILFIVGLSELAATHLWKRSFLAKARASATRIETSAQLSSITIIIACMCASVATYGLLSVIFGERFEVLLVFVALSLIGYQAFRLRPRDFKTIEE